MTDDPTHPKPQPILRRVVDLLTLEEQESLYRDLAEMARLRRRAYDESRNIVLP